LFQAFKEERVGATLRSWVRVSGVLCRAAVRDAEEGVRGVEGSRVLVDQRDPFMIGLLLSNT
jgi:hypothetical protein